jgi:hypothetical protein
MTGISATQNFVHHFMDIAAVELQDFDFDILAAWHFHHVILFVLFIVLFVFVFIIIANDVLLAGKAGGKLIKLIICEI